MTTAAEIISNIQARKQLSGERVRTAINTHISNTSINPAMPDWLSAEGKSVALPEHVMQQAKNALSNPEQRFHFARVIDASTFAYSPVDKDPTNALAHNS